jgi:hypothetical protein
MIIHHPAMERLDCADLEISRYVVSAGDHRRFTVSLAPTGEARTEDTEVTEDFLVIDEPLPL